MPRSQRPLPSFSLVLTSPNECGIPVEVLVMKDFSPASRRELHLNLLQPKDDDPLMKTVDTRFAGKLEYEAHYDAEDISDTISTSSSDYGDTSSMSTTESDLNREFALEREMEIRLQEATARDDDHIREFEVKPPRPPHLQRPLLPQYAPEGVPMPVLDRAGSVARRTVSSNTNGSSSPRGHRGVKLLQGVSTMLRMLWHRLKTFGGLTLRRLTKDL
ncbi:hypothetical protein NMY22_g7813 [Coprinellus aureogranulatus]|nr:hypothetical protein NMY22_g7813 [Coprinellus aureogranulatus]